MRLKCIALFILASAAAQAKLLDHWPPIAKFAFQKRAQYGPLSRALDARSVDTFCSSNGLCAVKTADSTFVRASSVTPETAVSTEACV